MSEFKPQNRIVVGDDIQHLLINNLENKKTAYLENNPITIARERLKIALYFFVSFSSLSFLLEIHLYLFFQVM